MDSILLDASCATYVLLLMFNKKEWVLVTEKVMCSDNKLSGGHRIGWTEKWTQVNLYF